jgi:hypothetical protein
MSIETKKRKYHFKDPKMHPRKKGSMEADSGVRQCILCVQTKPKTVEYFGRHGAGMAFRCHECVAKFKLMKQTAREAEVQLLIERQRLRETQKPQTLKPVPISELSQMLLEWPRGLGNPHGAPSERTMKNPFLYLQFLEPEAFQDLAGPHTRPLWDMERNSEPDLHLEPERFQDSGERNS